MRQKSIHSESPSERIVKDMRRATRKRHSPEERIRTAVIYAKRHAITRVAKRSIRNVHADTDCREMHKAALSRLCPDTRCCIDPLSIDPSSAPLPDSTLLTLCRKFHGVAGGVLKMAV